MSSVSNEFVSKFAQRLGDALMKLMELAQAEMPPGDLLAREDVFLEVSTIALAGCLTSVLIARGADVQTAPVFAAKLVENCALLLGPEPGR